MCVCADLYAVVSMTKPRQQLRVLVCSARRRVEIIHSRFSNQVLTTHLRRLLPNGFNKKKQGVGGRPPRYAPATLLPCGRRSASRRRSCRPQRSSRFPWPIRSQAHRCILPWLIKRPGDPDCYVFALKVAF